MSDLDILENTDYLEHEGTKRHSGRYPWGSGEDPYQHEEWSWLKRDNDLKEQGFSEKERAIMLGCENTSDYRNTRSRFTNEIKSYKVARAKTLSEKGYKPSTIAEMMGESDSTVRTWLKENREAKLNLTQTTADIIKEQVNRDKYVDIGKGTNLNLGVTEERMKKAVAQLKEEGYNKYYVYIDQMGTNHQTTLKILAAPGVDYKEVLENKYNISLLGGNRIVDENGDTISTQNMPIKSVSSKRIKIRYAEEGGLERDGTIELRRGVDDISLGKARYAQVRIGVDGTHYLKGNAMYNDNMPDGIDIIFNTNKHLGTPKEKVFKEMKSNPNNPFGASIKDEESLTMVQKYYIDKNGKRQLSCINVVNEEGDWSKWSRNLPAQFLSKQSRELAKKQLNIDYSERKEELEEIKSLNNPTIKKKLLESYADNCDAAASNLKASSLPGQKTHVLLPFTSLKDNEVYAPNYENGTEVVLVRFPHGGPFEIPKLKVNNNNKEAKKIIGNANDAVGINSKVAEKLSGADFDGDTAIVIPLSEGVRIRTADSLPGLKNFDPKEAYPYREGMKIMTEKQKGMEMGMVSNLITDMTLKGATDKEIERAVKHSMVVIDAAKHKLDYKLSEKENRIDELKKTYQEGGASTLISKAKSPVYINMRKPYYGINSTNTDPKTGEKIVIETGEHYVKTKELKSGKIKEEVVYKKEKVNKMDTVSDARELISSGNYQMEQIYAAYANQMKALANSARKEYLATGNLKYSPSAKKAYSEEVASLNTKLKTALSNAPKERQAQLLANKIVEAEREANPYMDAEHIKKAKGQALIVARNRVGARKEKIEITDKEWEAIQAGAITENILSTIIDNSDMDSIRKRATPRGTTTTLTPAKIALIKSMDKGGYSTKDIAQRCGISTSTVSKYLSA